MARTSSSLAMRGSSQARRSAEREREARDPGREAQREAVALVARQRDERVQALAGDRDTAAVHVRPRLARGHRAPVEQDLHVPGAAPLRAEDEVDVLGLDLGVDRRARAGGGGLPADRPLAAVRERVQREVALDARVLVAAGPRLAGEPPSARAVPRYVSGEVARDGTTTSF